MKEAYMDIHVYIHDAAQQNVKLDRIITMLQQVLTKETKIMATLDDTLAAVTQESTVDDSIIALLQALAAQIAAGGLSAADQAKVDSIFAAATANSAKISAAVTANTPAAPPPAP